MQGNMGGITKDRGKLWLGLGIGVVVGLMIAGATGVLIDIAKAVLTAVQESVDAATGVIESVDAARC